MPARRSARARCSRGSTRRTSRSTAAAAAAIAQTGISGGEEAVALAVFILIGSLTILAPVAIYFLMGDKAKEILDGLKGFMAAHNAAIMTILLLVLGAKLLGDGIAGL